MKEKRTHEEYVEILDRITAYTDNCDSKASTVLGFIGVIVGLLMATDYISNAIHILQYMVRDIHIWKVFYLFFWGTSIALFLTGCVFLVLVLISHTSTDEFSDRKANHDSIIFFSAIASNRNLMEYKKKVTNWSKIKLNNDYISQIYICSIICDKKFKNYRRGIILIMVGFTIFSIFTVIGYFMIQIVSY